MPTLSRYYKTTRNTNNMPSVSQSLLLRVRTTKGALIYFSNDELQDAQKFVIIIIVNAN